MSLTDESNSCFICWDPLTKEYGRKEIIHKYDKKNKSSEKWQHSCHEKCLNSWIKQCITVGDGTYPKCPICNDFKIPINKIPKALRERATEILEQEQNEIVEEEEEEPVAIEEVQEVVQAKYRLERVKDWINYTMPFLGILVCFNGVPISKCSNITFNLTINGTFGDLKTALLNKNVDFYKSKGMLHFDNIAHNLNIKNWINWKYPSFRLSEIHYGIPPYTHPFEQLNSTHDFNDDNIPLSDLYLEYQTKAGAIILGGEENLINNERTPSAYKKLADVYSKKNIWQHGPTGPDDPGYIERGYRNNENPWFPNSKLYENGHYGENVTYDSLMWLTVHIDNV
jgi:hypothetical protein